MNLLDLVEVLEMDNIDILTYASPLKLVATGKILMFNSQTKVIDFGCGHGDALALWGKYFGIQGVGIEHHQKFCTIAMNKMVENNLADQIQIICSDASTYKFDAGKYNVASCINASMIWGGFRPTLRQLKTAIRDDGTIIFGEPYYTSLNVPAELREAEGDFHTEDQILEIIHDEGLELLFVKRANSDDCDNYRARFRGKIQEVSAKYMRQHYGSALFVMKAR